MTAALPFRTDAPRGTDAPLRAVLAAALLLLVSACTPTLNSDVARFHQLAAPQGESFRIVPANEKHVGSLEFATYANLVSGQLTALGYQQAADPASAQLEVKLGFGVSDGREKLDVRPARLGSRFWYGHPYGFYNHYHPFWGYDPFWDMPEVRSYTVFTRTLGMQITRTSDDTALFEGRAQSVGTDNRLPELMPYLVQAMFTNFPGESGKTERVSIELK